MHYLFKENNQCKLSSDDRSEQNPACARTTPPPIINLYFKGLFQRNMSVLFVHRVAVLDIKYDSTSVNFILLNLMAIANCHMTMVLNAMLLHTILKDSKRGWLWANILQAMTR